MLDMPYFMSDDSWFKFDYNQKRYVLTEKATDKAKESYEEWLKDIEKQKEG